ncbi:LCP family protein [Paenisporosarcina quisquiliarum]|uniref:LCP family protein n=1 Tax=Paenisporosarcina quisquiliarum TaxID=365346 RepID=A0A9X3RCC4_9BACL|nr:LCP family protein [Paenisporosarcina quisquiliarum]MCZ8536625.1 LCP family protein [Paenisporosarcina quisquiliarum]
MNRKQYKTTRSGASKKSLILKVSAMLIASVLISLTAYGIYLAKKAESAADKSYEAVQDRAGSELREEAVKPLEDNVSILFIGVDDSEARSQGEGNSRSDALMLATLNNKDKTVKLVSIPRDSLVYIPEAGYKDKITHALSYGGTKASIETVEELLEVPVDYYVRMNFNAFIDVVDALDGIYANVPYDHLEKDENDIYSIQLEEGYQKLDGRTALALARTRKLDNDIERGKRQQEILASIMDRASSAASFTKYGDVIDAVGDNMKTDMTFDEMKSFFAYIKNGAPDVDTLTLEGADDMSTGVYYWLLNEESLSETKDVLQSHLGLNPDASSYSDGGTETDTNELAKDNDYDNE